jgi:uncharacterized protein involved in response to NO
MSEPATPAERIRIRRDYAGAAFLRNGFRPFFLGAGVWSALAMLVWTLEVASVAPGLDPQAAYRWHLHEMLFGFLAAAIAGFLLTAVPNWTGRLPVRGTPLAALALLWLAGRLALLPVVGLPHAGTAGLVAAAIDSLFLPALALLVGREIVIGKNWRNLPVLLIAVAFGLGNIAFHLAALDLVPGLALNRVAHAALLLAVLLVTLIGGRITPSFTRNWLVKQGREPLPAPFDNLDRAGAAAVTLAALLLVAAPDHPATGLVCLAAGLLHAYRLSRWQGLATFDEPLVTILHLGYLWVALGFLLAGLAILTPHVPPIAAIHAFAAGAVGTMVLAVMTRATRGHTGTPLEADRGTVAVYALVSLAAVVRVGGAILDGGTTAYLVAGLAWTAAFALFTWLYLPLFLKDTGKLG